MPWPELENRGLSAGDIDHYTRGLDEVHNKWRSQVNPAQLATAIRTALNTGDYSLLAALGLPVLSEPLAANDLRNKADAIIDHLNWLAEGRPATPMGA